MYQIVIFLIYIVYYYIILLHKQFDKPAKIFILKFDYTFDIMF